MLCSTKSTDETISAGILGNCIAKFGIDGVRGCAGRRDSRSPPSRRLPQAERELQKVVRGMEELETEVARKKEASRTVKALRAQIAAAEVWSIVEPAGDPALDPNPHAGPHQP